MSLKGQVIATIQARMGATRLPGKVLKTLGSKPVLQWQIDRLKKSRLIDRVIVATSDQTKDDAIAQFCEKNGIETHRGPEQDILSRISGALRNFEDSIHLPFCGDSPLIDAAIVDEHIALFLKMENQYDAISNCSKTTYPPGQEVFVTRTTLVHELNKMVSHTDPLREHLIPHFTRNGRIKILSTEAPPHYNFPNLYLELDTEEDYQTLTQFVNHFQESKVEDFSLSQIIELYESNPDLFSKNQTVPRLWRQFREK